MTQTDIRITELMTRLTALERERAAIVAEIETLRSAPSEQTAVTKVISSEKADDLVDRNSTIESKIALFRRLFRGRSDVFPIRWENRKTGRSGYAPAWNGGLGFAKSRKSNARHAQTRRSLPSMTCRSNAIYAGPTRTAPRSLWASIRCLRIIPVRFWRRISTKRNGEEMSLLSGTPASVTKFLLLLSGLDPGTAPTPGFSSRSRYRQRRRAVSERS